MTTVVITGVTVTGNIGGAAMLAAAIESLSARLPGARFRLLSISPGADRAAAPDLDVVDARPLALLCLHLPLAVLAWPLGGLRPVRWLLARIPLFRALAEADLVVDLCGIAFVDGRGLPLLAYNIACCMPAIAMRTPIAKLAQALGPFRTISNRLAARFVLSRCAAVVARGEATIAHLNQLGINGARCLPDASFALEVGPEARARAAELLPRGERPVLAVCPSEVVNRLAAREGISLAESFADLLGHAIAEGWRVAVVPHSFGVEGSKNDDMPIARAIAARAASPHLMLIEPPQDPRLLRALLGRADLLLGCRFHSVVGALAMGVPALTIGWSHKYREMVEMLQPGEWTLDWRDLSGDLAFARFATLAAARDVIAAEIRARLPEVRRRAAENFALAARLAA